MKKITLILVAMLSFSLAFSQTTYWWRDTASNLNWNDNNNWWNGTNTVLPTGNEILIFDNDNIPATLNNLTNLDRYIIKFESSITVSRKIDGNATNTFYDYSGNWPEIQNNTSPTHIIGFPIKIGHTDMNIKASEGNLIFEREIDTNGKYLHFYGHAGTWPPTSLSNLKEIVLKGPIVGSGKLFLKQQISVMLLANATVNSTQIDASVLFIGDNGTTGYINSDVEMSNDAELIFNRSNDIVYNGIISGIGNLTKQGGGNLTLEGINTYTGTTTIEEGKLIIEDTGSINCNTVTVKNGGKLVIQNSNTTINNLIIETGGEVDIIQNASLTITNSIINNGTLHVSLDGSLVQTNDAAANSGSGTYEILVAIKNTIPLHTDPLLKHYSSRYVYFSSPTQSTTLNIFNAWTNASAMYSFDASVQNWTSETSSTTMAKGVGYIVRTKTPPATGANDYPYDGSTAAKGLTAFTGIFNNGISSHTLTFNAGGTDDDSILVGNPYPSAISSTQILTDNPSVNELHFWRHNDQADASGNFNENYAVRNSSGATYSAPNYIASGQGFFAVANAAGTLTFKNDLRVLGNNTNFLRPNSQNTDKAWFNLTTSTGVNAQILTAFIPNATDNWDNNLDAHFLNSGSYLNMYTNGVGSNAQNLVIQARAPLGNTDAVIPLGFNMNNPAITSLTIDLDHIENFVGYDIFIRDNQENIIHDIAQSDYTFTVNTTGNFNTRFDILFNKNTASIKEDLITNTNLVITNTNENTIVIKLLANTKITNFKAFDVLGKLLINKNTNATNFTIHTNVKSGTVLFVKATLENGQILSTKFVKI